MNESGEKTLDISAVNGLFYDESGRISPDPGELLDSEPVIDEAGVFSVLQFGAVIPPLSPWKGVRRLLPGYRYEGTRTLEKKAPPEEKNPQEMDPQRQADEIEKTLDSVLRRKLDGAKDPVLLFSGGVDSGLIASRLRALGCEDSLLVNYSFGEDDQESILAEDMARHLGLSYIRIPAEKERALGCLSEPGGIWPLPFADNSTPPTFDLASAVVDLLSERKRVIIDGTGADGAFGMAGKIRLWERISRIPALLRRMMSSGYGDLLWHRTGKWEYFSRILRRSVDLSTAPAVIARNPLAGSFYSARQREYVNGLLVEWIEGWAGPSLARQIVTADVALICANAFAQKGKPVLESAGHRIIYPFLDEDMLDTGLTATASWKMTERKGPLKTSLSRRVPGEMVYRPKSGFVDPKDEIFYSAEFIGHLRTAAEPSGPISQMLERKKLVRACDMLSSGKALPPQTYSLLWAVAFTDRWYRTAF